MSASGAFRLRVRAPGAPDRWVKRGEDGKSLALTNFADSAYVASRESMEAILRAGRGRRLHLGRDAEAVIEEART